MQIEDILVADKQLAAEILHDIKQAEQSERLQAAAAAANAAAPAGSTPHSPAPDRGGVARTAHKAGPSRFAATAARPTAGAGERYILLISWAVWQTDVSLMLWLVWRNLIQLMIWTFL